MRLADPANRPPLISEPPAAPDDKPIDKPAATASTAAVPTPSATPAKTEPEPPRSKEIFVAHSQFALVLAPTAMPLEEKVKSFKELYDLAKDMANGVIGYARDEAPSEVLSPNFDPFGFTGSTGYYQLPDSTGPVSAENTVNRGVEFGITYHDRTASEIGVHIRVNDTRVTPAADNFFVVDTKVSKDKLTFIKLGQPQERKQAWLVLRVDNFDAMPFREPEPVGTLPPDRKVDFAFTATDGQQVDTTKWRGKLILVDFWATWCGPCVASLPRVQELYDKFHKAGLEVISINMDSTRAPMDAFLKKHPHPWPQSVSAPAGENPLVERFKVREIPGSGHQLNDWLLVVLMDEQAQSQFVHALALGADEAPKFVEFQHVTGLVGQKRVAQRRETFGFFSSQREIVCLATPNTRSAARKLRRSVATARSTSCLRSGAVSRLLGCNTRHAPHARQRNC